MQKRGRACATAPTHQLHRALALLASWAEARPLLTERAIGLVGLQEREGGGGWRRGLGLRLGGEGGEERSGLVDLLAGHEARELVAAAGARDVPCGERAG